MRICLYIRVSTDEQAVHGYSIDSQRSILIRKAAELDMTIIKEYVDDGYTAKNMKRPAFQQMFKDAEQGDFEAVFFWRLDRLTRSSRDFHKFSERLQKHSVGFISATERIDTTTAIGRLQLELSVSLAQLERETIAERVFFVAEEQARKGNRHGGARPLGYDLENKKLTINKSEAIIVREVFNLYLAGTGMRSVALKLGLNSGAAVKYMLQNPVYIGKLRWNYVDGKNKRTGKEIVVDSNIEPILDELTFKRVQDEIRRRKKRGKRFTSKHLFSSVLRCARCGSHLTALFSTWKNNNGKQKYSSYRCIGRYEKKICDMPIMRESAIIDAFLQSLDISEEEIEKHLIVEDEPKRKKLNEIEGELEQIAKKKKKWQIAYGNDLISLDELRDLTQADREREEYLKSQFSERETMTRSHWSKKELIQQLKEIQEGWELIQNEDAKRRFITEAYEYICVDGAPGEIMGQGRRPRLAVKDFKFRV